MRRRFTCAMRLPCGCHAVAMRLPCGTGMPGIFVSHIKMNPGSLMPPIVNPSSLYNEEARRDATRIRIYNSVLQQIYTKIKAIARIPGNEKCLWYVVPEFIPGTPRFDVRDCIVYLVWNLRNVGYQVEYTHPNLMFISWRNHDDRYKETESPWAQVLGAARDQVLTSVPTSAPSRVVKPAVKSTAQYGRPSTASSAPLTFTAPMTSAPPPATRSSYIPDVITAEESELKRKSVLKKTTEYRPVSALPPAPPQASLTGTLTPRHVSFV